MYKKIFLLLILCANHSFGQKLDPKDIWSYIENEQIIEENKEEAHASFTSFSSVENRNLNHPEFRKSLNGIWKFKWVKSPKDRPLKFFKPSINVSKWETIKVPSNWEVEGFGIPIYVNHQYEFADYKAPVSDEMELDGVYPKNPGKVPHDYNPVGSYRRDFELDASWKNKEVFLHIGAMKSGGFVWINGKYIGYSQGSKLPAEFNISSALKKGKNTIALQIFRWTDGSYLECQDFWRISGIEREVYIYAQPKTRIKDLELISTLDKSYTTGKFNLEVSLQNHLKTQNNLVVSYQLIDHEEKVVLEGNKGLNILEESTQSIQFKGKVPNVRQWNAEHPNLYTLNIEVRTNTGKLLETTERKVGFRSVEITNGLLLVNGKVITLKGVNAQEADPETGHVMSEELILKDIRLWKENNINAVRLSHYPRGRRFYELCDEHGIYVVDEANIESHGMYYGDHSLAKKKSWEKAHVDRMTRLVERDKNHASVIIWSMGNEAGNGINFYAGYKAMKSGDPLKRPVQYERSYKSRDGNLYDMDWNTDIIVPQYPSPARFEQIGQNKTDRPFIPSEYAHAMGNSTGNFQDYWDIIEKYDNLQGGFIWDWVDQSIWKTNKKGERFYAYGGDYGQNMPTNNTFLNNGIVFPDRSPQPALYEVKKAHEFINFKNQGKNKFEELRVLIENLYDFTNLDQFDFYAEIKSDGTVLKKVDLKKIKVVPHTSKLVRISLDGIDYQPGTEYFLEITAVTKEDWGILKRGHVLAHEQMKLKTKIMPIAQEISNDASLTVSRNKGLITVKNDDLQLNFDISKGRIVSYNYKNTEYIKDGKGPKPNFWRAMTDNDFGNKMQLRNIEWKKASLFSKVVNSSYKISENGTVLLDLTYQLPGVETQFHSTYQIFGNGAIKVSNFMDSSEYKGDIPRIGMRMQLPKEFENLSYFGRGPWENYQDRKASSFIDLYHSKVKDQYVPYVRPQENGNRTDVRWLGLMNANKNGLLIVSASNRHLNFSALHMPNEDFDTSNSLDYGGKETIDEAYRIDGIPEVNGSKHLNDIKEQDLIQLNIDLEQRGVGGDDSWGARPQKKYQLSGNSNFEYGFWMLPIENGTSKKLIELSKKYVKISTN